MSMLGPYASYNKETGYAVQIHPTAEYTGIFERLNIQPKGVIHVGMWDFCEMFCYAKLVGDKVIGVEANPTTYQYMAKPVADKWQVKSFNECVSDVDDKDTTFYFLGEGSSLYQGQPQWNRNSGIEVKTKTLSTLIEENDIDMNQYDFLNIDVEGSELDVLKGFEKYLSYINVIDMETSLDDRHITGDDHQTIVSWLSERGFEIREMSSSYQNEGWGDSVFVRLNKKHSPFKNINCGDKVWGKGYLENHCSFQTSGTQQLHWQNNTPGFVAL
jgi:FkbM family methyltransferase